MSHFDYQNGTLHVENVPLTSIAETFGTPCYVYSRAALEKNWEDFNRAFQTRPHRICYAVKANPNIGILNVLARLGTGFDIVSQGELERVLAAGGKPENIIFSGVGKKTEEIIRALEVGIYCFNVESESELYRLQALAKQHGKTASIALRINPNIDAQTHPYISTGLQENKFGIAMENALTLCLSTTTLSHLNLIGIACHIGSQLTELSPFLETIDRLLEVVSDLATMGIPLKHINIGGGLGVCYQDETPPTIENYCAALQKHLGSCTLEIILEPGRSIVANTGILLTRIEYLKYTDHKNFAIVDAAMNDFLRPALYNAYHHILPSIPDHNAEEKLYDVVGPVCESSDFLGKNRLLRLKENALLAIENAGAYGFSMSSNYNSRPRPAEVLVDKNQCHLIRAREEIPALFQDERLIPQ